MSKDLDLRMRLTATDQNVAKTVRNAKQEVQGLDKSLDGVNRSGRGTASGMAALTTAGDEANRMFKLQKGALQQAGYQIQDFTVQVSSGTSAFVALGQQGSQLLGLLGPGGALLGAVLAIGSVVGGVLVNSFSDGENAVDALDAAMDRLNKTVEESDGLPVLTQQIRDLARESEVAARARISAAMQDAQNASEAAAKGIGEAFGELPIVSWFDPLTRDIDELTRSIGWFEAYLQTGQAQDQLTELGEMFGLSGDRAKQAGRQIGEMLTQLRANPSVENFQALENAMGSLIQEGGKPSQGILQLVGNLGTYFDTAREAADRTAFLQKALENLGVAAGDQGVADDVDQMISSLEDKANAVGKTAREIAVLKAEQLRDDGADAKAIQTLLDQIDATYDAIEAEKARQQALKDSANAEQQYNQWIDSLTASIDPLQQAEEEIAKIWKAFEAGDLEGIGRSQVQDYVDAMREGIKTSGEAADEYDQWVQNLTNSIDPLQKAEKEIAKIWAAFEAGDLGDIDRTQVQDYVDAMREGAMGVTDAWTDAGKAMDQFADSTSNSLRTLQGLFEEGDSGYKALAVGIQALNTLQAVNAVLNQSSGDPYSAWGRMAAMAATVASLGYAVGSLSGDATDPTAERQETQGTGTVLGSMREKTESIANATDLIADSTEQLVNINTGMLRALEAVQSGMLGAAALTARGLADMPAVKPGTGSGFLGGNRYMDEANTIAMAPAFDLVRVSEGMEDIVGWDPLQEIAGWGNDLAGSIMGGGKKVVDEGIKIVGGTLQEAINQTLVSAYATIKTDGGWFGSDKKRDKLIDLPDDVGRQFALTYEAIASSVREGAEAIGLLPADVESALNQFVVDAQTISLEDLDAQEQADELAAMFGVTFDELAGEVVPFLTEFQAAGEGLGETLARVSTQVRVLEEALMTIGGTYDVTPEENAHIANRLSDRLGGTEEFASALTGYENNFLSQAEQFSTLTRRLGDALGDLPLPETRAGFMALIQAQDLLTQEGQDNVATLLRLQGTADDYYSHLEDAANDALASLTGATDTAFSDLQASIRDQKSTLSDAYQQEQQAIRAEMEARLNANRIALNAAQEGLRSIQHEVRALEGAADSLRDAYEPLQELRRQDALQTVRDALITGDLSGTGEAAAIVGEIKASDYATRVEFERAQGQSLALLQALENEGGQQLTAAEQSVAELERQTRLIRRQGEDALEQAEQAYRDEIDALDQIITGAEREINALRGIETGVLSIVTAIENLGEALGQEIIGDTTVGGMDAVRQLYQTLLGREIGQEGKDYWSSELANGATLADVEWSIRQSPEYQLRLDGSHAAGLGTVPFDGYRAELHANEMVLPADIANHIRRSVNAASRQTDIRPVVEAIRVLDDRLSRMEAYGRQTTKNTGQLSRFQERWDKAGLKTRVVS